SPRRARARGTSMLAAYQMRDLHQALLLSFSADEFRVLLESRLGVRLDRISAAPDMRTQTYEVIQTAERAGWTADLVRAAYQSRPGHPQLASLYDALGLAAGVEIQGNDIPPPPTIAGAAAAGTFDVQTFRRQLEELSARVCRVEVAGGGQTTGF